MTLWTSTLVALAALAAVALGVAGLFRWLYVKVPASMAFIRTGLGGRKVVIDGGALILPVVHNIQWLSLETSKIEVLRRNREAFITKDRYRVDVGAEFYVKIPAEAAMIEAASRSLGEKSFSAEGIRALVEEKLVSAMRSAAAQMELVELHENRRGFALSVKEQVSDPMAQNGLGVEDVAVFTLDQTDKSQLDPTNIFDAEGLRQITAQTSARMQERNEIERNTEVAIRRKDVETVRLKLNLEREQEFAQAEQARQVESYQVEQHAQAESFRFEKERETREAEITRDRQVREAELAREVLLIDRQRERELAELARARAVEEEEQANQVAVLREQCKRIAEEEARLRAEAAREEADQALATLARRTEAEREAEVARIRSLHELDVSTHSAQARERLAQARAAEGEAEARVAGLQREAENAVDLKLVYRDVALRLIEALPQIAHEAMEPARHIDSIRVLDVNGLGGGAGAAGGADGQGGDPIRRVYEALLGTGAALPILRELLAFGQQSGVLDKLGETFPELKNVVSMRRANGDAATRP